MKQRFFICKHCGNILAMVKDKGMPVLCCGEIMSEIIPGSTDASTEKHIPVLPIMMETGLDSFYSAKDKFGEAQYLSPYVQDMTAISYEEKLKKDLESVLISSEMARYATACLLRSS